MPPSQCLPGIPQAFSGEGRAEELKVHPFHTSCKGIKRTMGHRWHLGNGVLCGGTDRNHGLPVPSWDPSRKKHCPESVLNPAAEQLLLKPLVCKSSGVKELFI